MSTTIQHRLGDAATWVLEDPILEEGELGYENDTGLAKMGDGVNPWTSLQYLTMRVPATVTGTTDTLAEADRFRLNMYSDASAVTVTVPTGTFTAGDWFWLQALGAGGLSLSTTGITINGSSPPVGVAQNEALLVIFTASNTISVLGGTV